MQYDSSAGFVELSGVVTGNQSSLNLFETAWRIAHINYLLW